MTTYILIGVISAVVAGALGFFICMCIVGKRLFERAEIEMMATIDFQKDSPWIRYNYKGNSDPKFEALFSELTETDMACIISIFSEFASVKIEDFINYLTTRAVYASEIGELEIEQTWINRTVELIQDYVSLCQQYSDEAEREEHERII